MSMRRFLTPLVAVVSIAFTYLKGVPAAGCDLPFEILCALIGLGFGLLAASLVRVERDDQTGRPVTQAGIAVFGGRLAFGWAASNVWRDTVGQFSMDHAITGETAWTAAFVLMAVTMVAAGTAVLAARSLAV